MVQRPLQSIVLNELKEIVISCKQYQLPVERRKKRTKVTKTEGKNGKVTYHKGCISTIAKKHKLLKKQIK
jgi:hypothetical protein